MTQEKLKPCPTSQSNNATAIRLQQEMNEAWDKLQDATASYKFKKQAYVNYCTQENVKGIYDER